MALLLCSSNIPNSRPQMGLQFLVVVGSWAGNSVSRIQSAQQTRSKDLFMVSLISIATVRDLNGLLDSTFVVYMRLIWTENNSCCNLLGSIESNVMLYPQG